MAKKKLMFGEEVELNKIPAEEILVGRTYLTYTGNLVKVISHNEVTDLMKVFNISESCHNYHDRKNVFFVKLIR
jgi:hypothetical protein